MAYNWNALDQQIWDALREQGPFTTSELSAMLNTDRKIVYRHCRKLEKAWKQERQEEKETKFWMNSALRPSDKNLFFFPINGEVLTYDNHKVIKTIVEDLKKIALRHGIPRNVKIPDNLKVVLLRDYEEYLDKRAAAAPPRQRERILKFKHELMGTIRGTLLTDILAFFGLRVFRPNVRVWAAVPGAPAYLPGVIIIPPSDLPIPPVMETQPEEEETFL